MLSRLLNPMAFLRPRPLAIAKTQTACLRREGCQLSMTENGMEVVTFLASGWKSTVSRLDAYKIFAFNTQINT